VLAGMQERAADREPIQFQLGEAMISQSKIKTLEKQMKQVQQLLTEV
jgi:hypothetical protein